MTSTWGLAMDEERRAHHPMLVGFQVFDGESLIHSGTFKNGHNQERRAFHERLEDALNKGLIVILAKIEEV